MKERIAFAVILTICAFAGAQTYGITSAATIAPVHELLLDDLAFAFNTRLSKAPAAEIRATSLGPIENRSDEAPEFSCLQLQAIDEVDLLGDNYCE